MNYELTGEQKKFQEEFRAFCEREIAPHAARVDREGIFPAENHKKLAGQGFLGLPFPEKYGGSQKTFLTCVLAWEELARACSSTYLSSGMGCFLPGMALHLFGTEGQKEKYLRGLVQGEAVAAWALSEPHCGSDLGAIKTVARREGKGYVIDGSKAFVTNGPIADWVVLLAVTDPGANVEQKMSAFLLEKKTPGFAAGPPLEKLGARGSPTSELIFKDCPVADSQRLGTEGKGWAICEKVQEYGRLASAAYSVGIGQCCLDESIRYAQKRQAFGRPIAHFQEVSFKIADMQTLVDTARLFLQRAAWALDEGLASDTDLSVAKLFASEAATFCANQAVQIHGGYGYLKGYKVEQLYRDAKLGEIREGTSEMQRRRIAFSLLGEGFK